MDALQYLKEKYEIEGNTHYFREPDLPLSTSLEKVCKYMQEYSDQQNAELLAWKESAMRELNALDLQSLGSKLGIGLGQSVSENIHAKVDGLMERVNELEVYKEYEMTFGPHLLCRIKVSTKGIEVIGAVNGWGDAVSSEEIKIQTLKK